MRAIFLTKLANLKSQRNSFLNSSESKINSNNDSKRTYNSIRTKPTIFSYLELNNSKKLSSNKIKLTYDNQFDNLSSIEHSIDKNFTKNEKFKKYNKNVSKSTNSRNYTKFKFQDNSYSLNKNNNTLESSKNYSFRKSVEKFNKIVEEKKKLNNKFNQKQLNKSNLMRLFIKKESNSKLMIKFDPDEKYCKTQIDDKKSEKRKKINSERIFINAENIENNISKKKEDSENNLKEINDDFAELKKLEKMNDLNENDINLLNKETLRISEEIENQKIKTKNETIKENSEKTHSENISSKKSNLENRNSVKDLLDNSINRNLKINNQNKIIENTNYSNQTKLENNDIENKENKIRNDFQLNKEKLETKKENTTLEKNIFNKANSEIILGNNEIESSVEKENIQKRSILKDLEKKKKIYLREKSSYKTKNKILENKIHTILKGKYRSLDEIIFSNEINFKKEKKNNNKDFIKKSIEFVSKKFSFKFQKPLDEKIIKKYQNEIKQKINICDNINIKNPYEETKISLKKIQTSIQTKNYEENNDLMYLILDNSIKNKYNICVNLLYASYLQKIYYNYDDELINYILFGEKAVTFEDGILKSVTLKKQKEQNFNFKFNFENEIYFNKFCLIEHKVLFRIQHKKDENKEKKGKKVKKTSSLNYKLEGKSQIFKKKIYNFKRISHKLDTFIVLHNKTNLKRKSKFSENELSHEFLDEETIFEILQKLILYHKHKNFKNFFLRHKDLIDIEKKDNKNNTLLNLSVQFKDYPISEFLINQGANVNTQNNYLNTPLHYAYINKYFDFIDLLLKNGADEHINNIYGQKYLEYQ